MTAGYIVGFFLVVIILSLCVSAVVLQWEEWKKKNNAKLNGVDSLQDRK